MPFLKIEKKASGTYLRIVESYRDAEGKTRHRILHSLGKTADYTPEQLRTIGLRLYELGGGELKSLLDGSVQELGRFNYGYVQVYNAALRHYGLDVLLGRLKRKHKLSYDLQAAVMVMLLERLQDPCSKRSNYIHQLDYVALEPVYLQHLYRSLDKLSDAAEQIQSQIFYTGRDLFNLQLDVVFYDVTTLYFESSKESDIHNRKLRRKGFSKDGKTGDTQVLFSMMIDRDKNPIGYHIFQGNTYEGHTLQQSVNTLKEKYNIGKVIVVADRGMMSAANINTITESGFEFIVGERLKNMAAKLQEKLLDLSNYKNEWIYTDNDNEKVTLRYTTLEHEGRTIIATYSDKRARKDKHDREQVLNKAQTFIDNPALLKKKAARHFLKQEKPGSDNYTLDEEKIKKQARFDGFLAIASNSGSITAIDALDQYKQLFKIEHVFRTFKSHLETRPMFHWTDKRINGHICLCYIAYTLQHWVLQQLGKNFPISITEAVLRQMLDNMQVSLLQHNHQKLYLRSLPQHHEALLQQRLGLKPLPPMLPHLRLKDYV